MIHVAKRTVNIWMYKIVSQDRDSPCVQNGTLSLSLCMPNLRAAAKPGDIVCGCQSTRGGAFQPKVLFVAEVEEIVDCKDYYWWKNKEKDRNQYRDRRDCVYAVSPSGNRWSIHGMNRQGIQEYLYLYSRMKANINMPKLDRKIILSSKYKTFFKSDGPKISNTFEKAILLQRRGIRIPNEGGSSYVEEEILGILNEEKHEQEGDVNQYDPKNPTPYALVRKMVSDKKWFKMYEQNYTMADIITYVGTIGDVPCNKRRMNARKEKDKRKGVQVRSISLGTVQMVETTYRYHRTFEPELFRLFVMVVKYGKTRWNLELDSDYGAVCINENFECGQHTDKYNQGVSYVVGGGQYTGGELVIDDKPYDIFDKLVPVRPDQVHYVKPFKGHRISIVFFTSKGHDI